MKNLSFRIRQARRKAALSQAGLADKVGVNRSAVAQWERVGGSRPTSENLARIAVATSIQFEWLATGRGRMTAKNVEENVQALHLNVYAHDEIEERMLLALRRLEYQHTIAITEMVESLAKGRLVE